MKKSTLMVPNNDNSSSSNSRYTNSKSTTINGSGSSVDGGTPSQLRAELLQWRDAQSAAQVPAGYSTLRIPPPPPPSCLCPSSSVFASVHFVSRKGLARGLDGLLKDPRLNWRSMDMIQHFFSNFIFQRNGLWQSHSPLSFLCILLSVRRWELQDRGVDFCLGLCSTIVRQACAQ